MRSSSAFGRYDFCEHAFFIEYILGYTYPANIKADKGSIVHKVMECLALGQLYHQENPKSDKVIIDDAEIGRFEVSFQKFMTEEFVNELVDASFGHYSTDSIHTWCEGDLEDCRKWTFKSLTFNKCNIFDPRSRTIVCPERGFDIEITEPWAFYEYVDPTSGDFKNGYVHIKGTVDLITELDEDTIELVDYKTGRRLNWATDKTKDYEYLKKDPQLMLYHYAVRHLYPQYKNIIITIFYINDGGPYSICFEPEHMLDAEKMLKKRFEEIRKNEMPKMLSNMQTHWKCQKLCPLYKNHFPNGEKNMCLHAREMLQEKGMDETVRTLQKPGFSIDYYQSPGSKEVKND